MSSPEAVVEVTFALQERQWAVRVPLCEGMTALDAVQASGLLEECREFIPLPLLLGVFGERIEESRVLREGDRVEIYRPLRNDPREARRRAALAARPGRRGRSSREPA